MWSEIFWLSFVTLITLVEGQQPYKPYDCRRPSTPCVSGNGFCEVQDANTAGTCVCNANFVGYDCSVNINNVPAACNVACSTADSICYSDGNPTHKCLCDKGYTGTACDQRRVRSTCTQDNIDVFIAPLASGFAGKVYVRNLPGIAQCQLTDVNGDGVYTLSLSLSGDAASNPCSISRSRVELGGNNIEYSYRIRVQYDNDISTIFDEEHKVVCIHDPNGNVVTGIVVDDVPINALSGAVVEQTMSVTYMDIIAVVRAISVANMAVTVTVGEDLNVQVILNSTTLYANHYVDNCVAYDLPPGSAGRNSKPLIVDGCPPRSSLNVVRPPLSKVGNVITIPIDAFKFDSGTRVYFECAVEVCATVTNPACLPVQNTCPYGGANSRKGRKKRQSPSDGETESIKIQGQFFVVELSPDPAPVTNTRHLYTQESCLQSIPFVTVTVVFATLLLFTLVVAIVLCIRNNSRNRQRPVKKYPTDNDGFYNVSMSKA